MDKPTISHLLALYITDSCYIIIPYFNSCVHSRYPITINCQNKETDFSVWLYGILASLRKTGKGEGGGKRRTGGKEKSSTYSFTWEGTPRGQPQRFTVKLKRSKKSATSRVLRTDMGW